jgi:aspartate kinase
MKVHLIQNSAISFTVCVENNFDNLETLLLQLKAKYKVSVEKAVNIFTLRHYTAEAINEIEKNKTVLIKQITPKTVQIVTKPPNK